MASRRKNNKIYLLRGSNKKLQYYLLVVIVLLVTYTGYHIVRSSFAAAGVRVSGNGFLLNGSSFTPEGFISVELLDTSGYSGGCSNANTTAAAANFGTTELNNLKTKWHSNTVRIHISQPVLSGASGVAYAQKIQTDVDLIRSAGFVVILSMQDESWGCGPALPLPGPETENSWGVLLNNTTLKNDPYIMFEIYNEPQNTTNTAPSTDPTVWNWPDWLNGGRLISDPNNQWPSYTPIGHQQMLNYLRSQGVTGVIIADGGHFAGHLDGLPLLQDPGGGGQVAYAVHPLYYGDTESSWNTRWGNLAQTQAVIADAWDGSGTSAQTTQFLAYEKDTVHVGVVGYAMDNFGVSNFMANTALDPTAIGQQFQSEYTNYFSSNPSSDSPTATPTPVTPTPTPPTVPPTPTPTDTATPSPTNGIPSSGSGTQGGQPPTGTLNFGSGTRVSINGVPVSNNGSINTTYLTNGIHKVTTTKDGKTTTTYIYVHNKLNLFQSLRNFLFARFTQNHTIMNVGTILITIAPFVLLGFIFRAQVMTAITSLSRRHFAATL